MTKPVACFVPSELRTFANKPRVQDGTARLICQARFENRDLCLREQVPLGLPPPVPGFSDPDRTDIGCPVFRVWVPHHGPHDLRHYLGFGIGIRGKKLVP